MQTKELVYKHLENLMIDFLTENKLAFKDIFILHEQDIEEIAEQLIETLENISKSNS